MNMQEAIDALPTSVEGLVEYLTLNGYTGVPEDPQLCPLANYFKMVTGHDVSVTDFFVEDDSLFGQLGENTRDTRFNATEAITEFVVAFDHGEYPALEMP